MKSEARGRIDRESLKSNVPGLKSGRGLEIGVSALHQIYYSKNRRAGHVQSRRVDGKNALQNKKLRNEPIFETRICLRLRELREMGGEMGWQTNPFLGGATWLYLGLSGGKWVRCREVICL